VHAHAGQIAVRRRQVVDAEQHVAERAHAILLTVRRKKHEHHAAIGWRHLDPARRLRAFAHRRVLQQLEAERLRPELDGAVLVADVDAHAAYPSNHVVLP
jgi:hypothetical protein